LPGGTKSAARKYDFRARKYEMTDDYFPDVNHSANPFLSAYITAKQPGGTTAFFTPFLQERQFLADFVSKVFSFSVGT